MEFAGGRAKPVLGKFSLFFGLWYGMVWPVFCTSICIAKNRVELFEGSLRGWPVGSTFGMF